MTSHPYHQQPEAQPSFTATFELQAESQFRRHMAGLIRSSGDPLPVKTIVSLALHHSKDKRNA